ncbi:MAG: amino acid permease [Planctomycetes bacterium]|nr:amino acid permease [Planctomycetota bacterium]
MELKKDVGLLGVFCIASGAMISSGLFILPGPAFKLAGPAVVVSYFLAGLLALCGMLSIAEIATAMPKAGGDYFYIARSLGPAVGTISGLLSWIALSLKSAFALVGMAAFARLIPRFQGTPIWQLAVPFALFFIGLNVIGIRQAVRAQIILVIGLISLMVLYLVAGFPKVDVNRLQPFAPRGSFRVISTAGFVFISYGGLLKIVSVAEEIRNPKKVIPIGMIFSLLVVGIFYGLMVFVTTCVLPAEELSGSLTPVSQAGRAVLGRFGFLALTIAAILAFFSTANAGIASASRYPLALSRDGLLPPLMGQVSERFKTPVISVLITGVFIIVAVFVQLDYLVKAASTVLILSYLLSCLSLIILREGRVQNYQPSFRAPLYPWLPIIGIAGYSFMLFGMGFEALLLSLLMGLIGFLVYRFYGRATADREYALLHLIERITARELTGRSLESELKGIIRERDEIEKDRFDSLIENCPVVDVEGDIELDDLFKRIAAALSPRLDIPAGRIEEKLVDRERQSSTAINTNFAIPHIIVDGEEKFDILLARCREGVSFSDDAPEVEAVFVLVGSQDQRNFHLRALAAIAQIVQQEPFLDRWREARNAEALRDAVLLGRRQRYS